MQHITTDTINDNSNTSLEIIIPNFNVIPNYLTKQNEYFQQFIHTTLHSNENIEKLQTISIIIYKIKLIEIYQHLWNTYMKSGTGQLFNNTKQILNYSINVSIWPKDIQQKIELTKFDKLNVSNAYLKYVQIHLNNLQYHLNYYQKMLTINVNNFNNYSFDLQKLVENYIDKHLDRLQKDIEHQIQLIHYDYHINAIKKEFMCQKPNSLQIHLMKEICCAKYNQEVNKQAYFLIQKQLKYYNSLLLSSKCSLCANSNTNKFLDFLKTKYVLMATDTENIREEMITYKNQYEDMMNQFYHTHVIPTNNNPSFLLMINLIEQGCSKIAERIQCIYRYKYQCIGIKNTYI